MPNPLPFWKPSEIQAWQIEANLGGKATGQSNDNTSMSFFPCPYQSSGSPLTKQAENLCASKEEIIKKPS
jgi:hypothetical protein